MGPQLDIDSIEATVAALTEEAGEGGTLIERDVPALCAEVRQLRQALAAVEKLCSDPAYVFDVGVACIRVSDIRAALGAAVTPTPQEDLPKLDDTDALQALRWLVNLKDGPRDADYAASKPLAWQFARDVLAAPSGLQRATEQQELECQFCGTPGADCTDDTGCCSYCAHEPVGGSDTPADQPERCIHGKIADDQHHRNGDSCFHPFRCLDRCEVPAPADQPPQVCNYGGRE